MPRKLSLNTSDVVRVSWRHGAVVLRANVTEKTTPGVVFIPMHFVEAASNLLTIDLSTLRPRSGVQGIRHQRPDRRRIRVDQPRGGDGAGKVLGLLFGKISNQQSL